MRGRLEREPHPDLREEPNRRSPSRAGGAADSKDLPRTPPTERPVRDDPRSNARERRWSRNRSFELRESELETMTEIGRFRMIDVRDLVDFRYEGDRSQAEQDLRNLIRQRLARRIRLVLPTGNRYPRRRPDPSRRTLPEPSPRDPGSRLGNQKLYSGFVKPAEARHDAAIYRMYQLEAEKIRLEGGKIRRLVLDYELKAKVFRPLSKLRHRGDDAALREKQKEVSSRHDLPIVRGRVAFPDLRIEYERRDGELDHRDLELATEHYRPGQLAQKRLAGFKIYFAGTSRSSGSTVKDERELTAEILR